MKGPLFYAKILLFGEYGIIKDSKGLAIPYNQYKGGLQTSDPKRLIQNPDTKRSNENLKKFASYLKKNQTNINTKLDIQRLEKDISNGLYFDSTIKQGYGIGSSGALVAAIYEEYAQDKITVLENLTREKLLKLKVIFSKMESFFHGDSSGLDPLNCYLSLPILIHSKQDVEPTGIPSQKSEIQNENKQAAVFLLDSGMVGETAPMVNLFMEKMKQEGFRNMLKHQFTKYTDACIEDFLKGNISSLLGNTKSLSKIVLDHFKPMIPNEFHGIWKQGIESNAYYLKLCGSGGGGYILGFARDIEETKKLLKGHDIEVVYSF